LTKFKLPPSPDVQGAINFPNWIMASGMLTQATGISHANAPLVEKVYTIASLANAAVEAAMNCLDYKDLAYQTGILAYIDANSSAEVDSDQAVKWLKRLFYVYFNDNFEELKYRLITSEDAEGWVRSTPFVDLVEISNLVYKKAQPDESGWAPTLAYAAGTLFETAPVVASSVSELAY